MILMNNELDAHFFLLIHLLSSIIRDIISLDIVRSVG